MPSITLCGVHMRLVPLEPEHAAGLAQAAQTDSDLYRWTFVPEGLAAARQYVATAVAAREAGNAVPFAVLNAADESIIGSTRFFDLTTFLPGRTLPDACEIGYTWYSPAAIRTAVNTECKLLMMTHAFETWGAQRVSFQTDARNQRSRTAIERIGGQLEGIIRAQRLGADGAIRDSARYSIIAAEWPDVKARLTRRLSA